MRQLSDLYRSWFQGPSDRKAIVCGDDVWTYGLLQQQAEDLACLLREAGVTRGSKAAMIFPSEGDFIIAFIALGMIGAIPCPLNIESKPRELQQLLEAIDPDLVLVTTQEGEHQASLGKAWSGPVATSQSLAAGAIAKITPRASDPELSDVALILCTSGTTGSPKAAMLTNDNLIDNLRAFKEHLLSFPGRSWQEPEVFGNPIPLSHPYGLIMMTLMPLHLGGVVVLIPRFSPASCLRAIETQGITTYGGVPGMYAMLNRYRRSGGIDTSSCRLWICGGAPLPRPVAEAFAEQYRTPICEGFGMLETSSLASLDFAVTPAGDGSAGPFHAEMKAEIRDEQGALLPDGEVGELWLQGPNIMKGYYRNPEATAEALQAGWLKTGDLGCLRDGRLFLKGRSKEVIIVSGHNVYPQEVENVILSHEEVADAAVAAESDPVRGERLVGFYVPRQGCSPTSDSLVKCCRESLSAYRVPREFHRVDAIPRNAAGKIVRRELVKQFHSADRSP